jgi:hypothetical protein
VDWIAALRRTVAESIFISSCSRRELARRRPTRNPALRLQLIVALLLLLAGVGAVFAARGGL